MSGRYSRYRRTTNYPYRRGVSSTRTSRSSVNRRAQANIRNAFQQKDTAEVVINAKSTISCGTNGTVAALNVFDALLHSEFYNNYAPMYDQLKLDKVKAKFTALSWAQDNNHSNFTIYTAFDRNGLDEGQIVKAAGNTVIRTNIGQDVITYSSALSKNLNSGAPFEVIRYINPSTVQEKSQYLSTDSLRAWYDRYDVNQMQYVNNEGSDNIPYVDPKNPCYLEKFEGIPFKPTYLVGVESFGNNGGICVFNVELDICITFRGLRKSRTM